MDNDGTPEHTVKRVVRSNERKEHGKGTKNTNDKVDTRNENPEKGNESREMG